jgi:hypothetical protein
MPDTTNAEEAMHWKLYSAVGRDLSLMDGLHGLHAVAEYYLRIYTASLSMYFVFTSRNMFQVIQYGLRRYTDPVWPVGAMETNHTANRTVKAFSGTKARREAKKEE